MSKEFQISEKNFIEIDTKIIDLQKEISELKKKVKYLEEEVYWLNRPPKFKLKDKISYVNNERIEGVVIDIIKEKGSYFYPYYYQYLYRIITEDYTTHTIEENLLSFKERIKE